MAHAAVPLLLGTGVQILGAKMGWDPRLTAFASIAAGGIGAGMATGAFSGGVAAQAATGVASSVNPHAGLLANAFTPTATVAPVATGAVWNPTTVGQGAIAPNAAFAKTPTYAQKYMSPPADLSYSAHAAGPHGMDMYASPSAPTWRTPAVAEVKAPFFDRTQYTYKEEPYTLPDGTKASKQVRIPKVDGNNNIIKGMSQADALGVNMLDTFMQYELALAKQPKPRPTRSGGGGGGGGGGPAASYQGGGGSSGQKQVTWGFGGGNNNGYQPQGLV